MRTLATLQRQASDKRLDLSMKKRRALAALASGRRLSSRDREQAQLAQEAMDRAIDALTSYRDRPDPDDPDAGFRGPADFFSAVADVAVRGRLDPRLRPLAVAGSDEQGEYDDARGGFFLPMSASPFLLSAGSEDDPCAGRTLPVPMTTPIVTVVARCDKDHSTSLSGGLVVVRRLETDAPDPVRAKFEQIVLSAHEAFGLTFASNILVADSFPSFAATLGEAFRDEFSGLYLNERLRGTGVGEPSGILGSPATIVVDPEALQAPATILAQNVAKMRARCWGYSRAVWLACHDAMPQIMALALPAATGDSTTPLYGVDADGHETLAGRPLYTVEQCSALGTEGDLILANWSQYLDGEYQSFRGINSIFVRYMANETAFKFWARNDGSPWWRSPLTPRNSAVTLSPFVVLKTRT